MAAPEDELDFDGINCEYSFIERPLISHQHLRFGSQLYDSDFDQVKHEWSHIPMLRLWSHGYKKSVLLIWFASFPPELVSIFKRSLGIVHQALVARISHLENLRGICNAGSYTVEAGTMAMDTIWCEQAPCACMRVNYDPVTQARTSISVNMQHEHLLQMHREEFMARIGHHDLDFPVPSFDFLCIALDNILQFSVDKLERYMRYSKNMNGARKAMLVFASTIRRYNSVGQIVEVNLPTLLPV
jgi:hypothetical protein